MSAARRPMPAAAAFVSLCFFFVYSLSCIMWAYRVINHVCVIVSVPFTCIVCVINHDLDGDDRSSANPQSFLVSKKSAKIFVQAKISDLHSSELEMPPWLSLSV